MSATMTPNAKRHGRRRMGEILVDRGLVDETTLQDRLDEHDRRGVPLGRVLVNHGDVTRRELWAALGETWGIDVVDLVADPPDPAVLEGLDPADLLRDRWLPLHRGDPDDVTSTLTVAVCEEPDEDLAATIRVSRVVDDVRFVATTDWDLEQAVMAAFGEEVVRQASYTLAESQPDLSAIDPIARWQKVTAAVLFVLLVAAAVVDWRATLLAVLIGLNVLFGFGVAFKLVSVFVGMRKVHRIERKAQRTGDDTSPAPGSTTLRPLSEAPPADERRPGWNIPDADLPKYTILVPAYKEKDVVRDIVEHMSQLDYPLAKLQVLLLLEDHDTETVEEVKAARPPEFVRIVQMPKGGPQTKPKACNVGLAMAEGEFLVIYDAEDRPEPGQLREAVATFRSLPDDVVCLQARLNYDNTETNLLTRMFTLEYSFWFDYMLPGLDAMRLPVPLGGTSNHFRTDALRQLGAWDPFNVTEDADLGVRASALGMQVGIIDSTTWEEACSETRAWICQRTRWIKGYMVTSLVQLRRPFRACRRLGVRGMAGLLGLIAGTPAMFLASPVLWVFFLATLLFGGIPGFVLPAWAEWLTFGTLVIGNLSMVALSALAARRRRNTKLMPFALLNPLYWMLHSIAAWRALWQLVVSPSHWEKTPHGLEHGPEAFLAKRAGS